MKVVAYYRDGADPSARRPPDETPRTLAEQREAIDWYVQGHGFEIVAEYTDFADPDDPRTARPGLTKALHHAKRIGATLIVGYLWAVARHIHVLPAVVDEGVEFIAVRDPLYSRRVRLRDELQPHEIAVPEPEAEALFRQADELNREAERRLR